MAVVQPVISVPEAQCLMKLDSTSKKGRVSGIELKRDNVAGTDESYQEDDNLSFRRNQQSFDSGKMSQSWVTVTPVIKDSDSSSGSKTKYLSSASPGLSGPPSTSCGGLP
ncbi:hypothetical protein BaRGS_00006698 [Batillaria attramentaria]|uniref:Uncharacterized protein n=1 Tax=Batillaria attramentaria TaxID=370345 RepID=A0ABD0LRZ3_9CAEN